MKRLLFLPLMCLVFASTHIRAQSPPAIPYQCVVRDSIGNLLENQYVAFRLTIHEATSGGSVDYQERDSATTNNLGLLTLNIGQGAVLSGSFSSVNWSSGAKYLQVEMDPSGGTYYTNMGTTQLNSVPYALFALNSSSDAIVENQVAYGNGAKIISDSLFTRNDSTQYTGVMCHSAPGILEGISIGGPQVSGLFPDGTFIQRMDSTENHVDLVGVGNFENCTGNPHGVGLGCVKQGAGQGLVLIVDSDPAQTVIEMISSNTAQTNYQGIGWLSPTNSAFGTVNGTIQQGGNLILADTTTLYIQVDSTQWAWPTADGSVGAVLSTNGHGALSWSSYSGGALPVGQVGYGSGAGIHSDSLFIRQADGATLIEAAASQNATAIMLDTDVVLIGAGNALDTSVQGSMMWMFKNGSVLWNFNSYHDLKSIFALGNYPYEDTTAIPFVETAVLDGSQNIAYGLIAIKDSVQLITSDLDTNQNLVGDNAIVGAQLHSCYLDVSYAGGSELNSLTIDTDGVHWEYMNTDQYVFPLNDGTANQVMTTDGSAHLKWTNGQLPHTLFTPTTGGTVNLTNNSYNIVNPTGSLSTLTINLPSSPADNDVVEIKYTQAITTVSYSNGTVPDGLVSPGSGGYIKLVYDNGSSTWY